MSAKLYTLRLTKEELYNLKEAYHANWTAPEERNEMELDIAKRLDDLYQKAWRDAKRKPKPKDEWPPAEWRAKP